MPFLQGGWGQAQKYAAIRLGGVLVIITINESDKTLKQIIQVEKKL